MHACHWHCCSFPRTVGLTCWGRGEQCALRIGPNERRSWSGGETMWTVHINTTRTILPNFCLGLNINWLIVLMDPVKTKEYKAAYYQRNKHKFREWANARYHRTNPKSREEILDAIVALQKRLQADRVITRIINLNSSRMEANHSRCKMSSSSCLLKARASNC